MKNLKRVPNNVQDYVPIDNYDAPSASVWKAIILLLQAWVLVSSIWVFSEMPGDLTINSELTWSSNQTWYAAVHFTAVSVVLLLTWLKR